jgi:hypothetical protein
MTYQVFTTLNKIRGHSPCKEGWEKLLVHLGKTAADAESLSLLTVLDSNGFDDALWVLDRLETAERTKRHFAAWCAEQALPLFERAFPDDVRPRTAIAVVRDDNVADKQRTAAKAAAKAAARAAAWDAVWYAAWDAARAAAWDAALAAAWSTAAWGAAAEAAQAAQLRKMLTDSV